MPIGVHTIRQRIQAQIKTSLGGAGWHPSRHVYDVYGADTRYIAHQGYAVGVLPTRPTSEQRQRRREGAYVETIVGVRWSRRVRADAQVDDYDAALAAELDLVAAVMATDRADIVSITLAEIPARAVDEGGEWFLGELRFAVHHLYPLE